MTASDDNFGKKVFFLNPPAVIGEVLPILAENEFEVYTTTDHARLARYIKKDPKCLVFVNIDEDEDEQLWRTWIRGLREDPLTAEVGIGVFTMLGNDDQRSVYLMDLGVSCGFIVLKIGAAKTADILKRTLEANEAKGRRKFVRVRCPPDSAEFNCKLDNEVSRGKIIDLSTAGMAVSFSGGATPPKNSRLKDIQLSLRGNRIMVNGILMGSRPDEVEGSVCLVLFEPASLNPEKRQKLRNFIGRNLQTAMNENIAMS